MRKNYKQIYEHLGDELSKELFGYRVIYAEIMGKDKELFWKNYEKDMLWTRKIVSTVPEFSKLINLSDAPNVIFGAGDYGKLLIKACPISWECLVDNYKYGTEIEGISVISFDEYLNKYKNANIFVASDLHHTEMKMQLQNCGIAKNKIFDLTEICNSVEKKEYFDLPELFHEDDEVFVDCGCCDGQTSVNFIEWCGGKYKHIYAFEAETGKIEKCRTMMPQDRVTIFPIAVGEKRGILQFSGTMDGESHVTKFGETAVSVDSLDNVLRNEKVTFIKMDIEGSELDALKGAREVIKKNHPKLAISVYHRPNDIYEIPQMLLEYNADYIFYLRHYFLYSVDTVLYAIDKKHAKRR